MPSSEVPKAAHPQGGLFAGNFAPANPRDRLIVALDFPAAAPALALAGTLQGATGWLKVGKQLFTAAGPELVRDLIASDNRIFLDLKFHDIPSTVAGAVRAAAELGIVTPGIRPAAESHDDQARVVTPTAAIRAGASHLVVGRPITQAPDPRQAAEQMVAEIAATL